MEKDRPSLRSSGNSKGCVFVSTSMNTIKDFSLFTYYFYSAALEEQQCNQRDGDSSVYGLTLSRRVGK